MGSLVVNLNTAKNYCFLMKKTLFFLSSLLTLSATAQNVGINATGAAPAAGAADAGRVAAEAPNPIAQFAPILIIGVFFYFILLRPQQKEQRRRQDFLNNLKKNAKVVTTGGLIGTVVDISSDGRQVTLRVDDTTRIRFLRSAIHGELDEKADTPAATT